MAGNPPPVILNGLNYPEWKVKMEHYIKADLGMDVWMSIQNGWCPPPPMVEDSDSDLDPDPDPDPPSNPWIKPMTHWTDIERLECEVNSRALNAIFSSVKLQQFKGIAFCASAKEAWEKLQATYEKTGKLRDEELDDLQLKFCKLEMGERESVSAFYERVVDIAYEAGTLGIRFDDQMLVSKIVDCVPARYLPVVSDVKQRMNVTLGELIGELRAYEKKVSRLSGLKKL